MVAAVAADFCQFSLQARGAISITRVMRSVHSCRPAEPTVTVRNVRGATLRWIDVRRWRDASLDDSLTQCIRWVGASEPYLAGALISSVDDAIRLNTAIGSGLVVINNAGTIVFTGTGQTFDLASNTSATGTVQINNAASGILRAAGSDVIRPGSGTTVITNSGLIDATASANRAIHLESGGPHDGQVAADHQ
jgi:hypothetical protein